jgi:4-hydroxy-3-polyprenylbenzoate decarboxylase
LDVLLSEGREVMLTISPSGAQVLAEELGIQLNLDDIDLAQLVGKQHPASRLHYFHYQDYQAPIASGSSLTGGMVICPCSGATLSAVAHAASNNLIQRAAEVHLKERRRLILVPRETPLSLPQLDNMKRACEAGAVILPAMPGWYHGVEKVQDLVDFVVARILDQLGVPHRLLKRWGGDGGV